MLACRLCPYLLCYKSPSYCFIFHKFSTQDIYCSCLRTMGLLHSLFCSSQVGFFLKIVQCLPCELWLRRSDARVRRVLLRLRALSEASVCSRSAEKSESSVPSELLPAVLWKRQHQSWLIHNSLDCHQTAKRHSIRLI